MRRWLAVLSSCLLSASLPSPVLAQFARAARPLPAVHAAPGAVPSAPAPFAPGSAPTLSAPAAPGLLPTSPTALPVAAARASAARTVAAAVPAAAVSAAPLAAKALPAAAAAVAPTAAPALAPLPQPREDARPDTAHGRLGALSVAKDAEPLWTGGIARGSGADVWAGRAPSSLRGTLGRPSAAAAHVKETPPADAPVSIPEPTLRRRAADALHYVRITGSSLWWYTFPRLVERWEEVAQGTADGRARAVRRIMGFFIAHRVLGSTGSYAPMGFRVATNRTVILDAWRIYIRYFPDDPGSAESFARLVARATLYNPNRRSTQFRKVIFHALREAAVLPPDRVAAYFDSLVTKDKSAELAAYQAARQGEVLALFDETVKKVILELNAGLPRGRRVVGAVLLGSFANGAAGPGSDLDVQALSEDGGTAYNAEFLKRLKARWKAEGDPTHPASGFEYALPLSKELLQRVHREAYLVLSPYPEVVAALSTAADERRQLDMARTKGGLAFVVFYSAVLFGVLAAYEAWRLAKKALGR